jgi:Trk-type K+ transport system membrane component
MSLKAFHIVFVVASILLAFGFAAWSLMTYSDGRRLIDLIFGIVSALSGVGLVIYGRYVLRKLKHISYL